MNDVRVDVGRLRWDAGKWNAVADGVQRLATAAGGLVLTSREMSFAADDAGATSKYQELQQRIVDLCNEAVGRLNGIAGLVTTAADGFAVIDESNRDKMNATFDEPKPPR